MQVRTMLLVAFWVFALSALSNAPAKAEDGCESIEVRLRFSGVEVNSQDAQLMRQQLRLFSSCTVARAHVQVFSGDQNKAERERSVRAALEEAGVAPGKIVIAAGVAYAPTYASAAYAEAARAPDSDGARLPRYAAPSAQITITFQ